MAYDKKHLMKNAAELAELGAADLKFRKQTVTQNDDKIITLPVPPSESCHARDHHSLF